MSLWLPHHSKNTPRQIMSVGIPILLLPLILLTLTMLAMLLANLF
jgi:hypothetical protein